MRRAQDDRLGFRFIHHLAEARRTGLHFREVAPALHLFQQEAPELLLDVLGCTAGRCLGLLRCQLGYKLRPEGINHDFILRNPEIVKPVPEEVNEEQI